MAGRYTLRSGRSVHTFAVGSPRPRRGVELSGSRARSGTGDATASTRQAGPVGSLWRFDALRLDPLGSRTIRVPIQGGLYTRSGCRRPQAKLRRSDSGRRCDLRQWRWSCRGQCFPRSIAIAWRSYAGNSASIQRVSGVGRNDTVYRRSNVVWRIAGAAFDGWPEGVLAGRPLAKTDHHEVLHSGIDPSGPG